VSAEKILENYKDTKVERIPICCEDGITAFAFAFKEVMDNVGPAVTEVAMDSTCASAFRALARLTDL
jgi:hypothetical protein